MICITLVLTSCKKDKAIKTNEVTIQLNYPTGSQFTATSNVLVKMIGRTATFEVKTDATGKAIFTVPTDVYEISASETRSAAGKAFNYNALLTGVVILDDRNPSEILTLNLKESKTSQLMIKEVYIGGVPKDDGSGAFVYDSYITIYNNSDVASNTNNLCIGAIGPYNAHATNNFYDANGKLIYENENWIPAIGGYWFFQQNVVIKPHEQIVVALYNAVNNTLTHSKSINFDNPAYYATYDIAGQYKNANYYVSPAASIATSHYLKSVTYAAGNAWTPSVITPGIILFETKGVTPAEFGADASSTVVVQLACKKLPIDWVVDGVESFNLESTANRKRFLPSVDAGYVMHTNRYGYSIYRNVDEAATKAIAGNEAKLVKNYQNGTVSIGGTTDPSGIDAEASIKNGATIIYKDTNNSSNDMHLRAKAALRTN